MQKKQEEYSGPRDPEERELTARKGNLEVISKPGLTWTAQRVIEIVP